MPPAGRLYPLVFRSGEAWPPDHHSGSTRSILKPAPLDAQAQKELCWTTSWTGGGGRRPHSGLQHNHHTHWGSQSLLSTKCQALQIPGKQDSSALRATPCRKRARGSSTGWWGLLRLSWVLKDGWLWERAWLHRQREWKQRLSEFTHFRHSTVHTGNFQRSVMCGALGIVN